MSDHPLISTIVGSLAVIIITATAKQIWSLILKIFKTIKKRWIHRKKSVVHFNFGPEHDYYLTVNNNQKEDNNDG